MRKGSIYDKKKITQRRRDYPPPPAATPPPPRCEPVTCIRNQPIFFRAGTDKKLVPWIKMYVIKTTP